jgi:hypothetical protein
MKTLTLIATWVVACTIIFVLPAIMITIVFPCSYYDVVTFPLYIALMLFISIFGASAVTEELDRKN